MKVFKKHGILPPKPEGLKPSQRLLIHARPTNAITWSASCFQCAQSQAAVLLLDDPGPIAHNEEGWGRAEDWIRRRRTVMAETRQIT